MHPRPKALPPPNKKIHGKLLASRINDRNNNEQRIVLKRLLHQITPAEFKNQLRQTIADPKVEKSLISAVEKCARNEFTSPTVDLFVLDEIFKSGITAATAALKSAAFAMRHSTAQQAGPAYDKERSSRLSQAAVQQAQAHAARF